MLLLDRWFYRTVRMACGVVCRAAFRLRVEGREHLPSSAPYLIAANHISYLDPPVVGVAWQQPIHYVAKEELFRIPILRWALPRLNAIPVKLDRPDVGVIRQALTLLQQGAILVVFPEGGRSPTGALQPAKRGVGLLAMKAGVPIVPVGLVGTDQALPRGARWIRCAPVTVRIGPPIAVTPVSHPTPADYVRIAQQVTAALAHLLNVPCPRG